MEQLNLLFNLSAIISRDFERERIECTNNILSQYGDERILVAFSGPVILNLISNVTYSVIDLSKKFQHFDSLDKYNYYLIITSDLENIKLFLSSIYRTVNYNSKAHTFVVFKGEARIDDIFTILWNYYLINALLLYGTNIYTYYPVSEGRCLMVKHRFLSSCKDFSPSNNVFNESKALQFNDCPFRILTYVVEPYVSKDNLGFEACILESIAKHLNLIPKFVSFDSESYGRMVYPNNSYTSTISKFFNKEGDILMGCVPLLQELVQNFDYTHMIYEAQVTFYVPLAKNALNLKGILMAFDMNLWFALMVVILLVALSVHILAKQSFSASLFLVSALLIQSVPRKPKSTTRRIIFYFWTVFCMIITCAFQSQQMTSLFKPVKEKQIKTVQEMVDANIEFGGQVHLRNRFASQSTWIDKIIYERYKVIDNIEEYLQRLLIEKDFCILEDVRMMNFLLDSNDIQKVYELPISFLRSAYLYLDKGSPYTERFNKVISIIRESGFNFRVDKYAKRSKKSPSEFPNEPLKIQQLRSIYIIYFIGNIIAICAFIYEKIFKK